MSERSLVSSLVRLVRPKQWVKSAFVLVGPLYGLSGLQGRSPAEVLVPALLAAAVFALASSACYIMNDIVDAPLDRAHPRKKNRPIASGAVTPRQAGVLACVLVALAVAGLAFIQAPERWWVAGFLAAYVLNVNLYSMYIKRAVIGDVMSLSLGFVLRVLGGCAAVGIAPSSWLLNCTLFIAMFLAFGKRLGERRTMAAEGADVAIVRAVQSRYTDDLLRMSVVVTGVATLITYAGYVQAHETEYTSPSIGTNLLWLTMLPATYGLLRCIVLLERGIYDDPTELATKDRGVQAAVLLFGAITGALIARFKLKILFG